MWTSPRLLFGVVWGLSCLLWTEPVQAERPTPEELARRDRWVREHFPEGRSGLAADLAAAPAPPPGLMVWTNLGPAYRNVLPNRPLQIADREFASGLYAHAPSRIGVRLPGPARSFSAVVGILTNPDSQGGSIEFSVLVGDERLGKSPVKHRGEEGSELQVDLQGAQEFVLAIGCAGDGLSSDQGVWGDARATLVDGHEVRLGDMPLLDPRGGPRWAESPPFAFTFGGESSDRLLGMWAFDERVESADPGRRVRIRSYRDPGSGLIVRSTVVEYTRFPSVEWTLTFENTGTADTPRIEGILPLDTRQSWSAEGPRVHYFVGSPCQANDYEPLERKLAEGEVLRVETSGGRPTNAYLPYFNVELGGEGGVIAALGWAGQWAAEFTRDEGAQLRLAGGQEATSFRLRPGEQVRSPLVVLQFYEGDWIRAQNVWRAWMMTHNVPRRDGKPLKPFVFGCTGNAYPGLKTDEAAELQFFESYAREKILPDYWDQDAGWYPCGDGWWNVGTWEVDRTRFPNGLRRGSDWLRAHDAGQIVWFEPERAVAGSWLAEHHPEWCFGGRGGGLMNLGDPAFRRWITDRIDQLISSEGIDFYRQDFNIDPLYWWRAADAEDRQGVSEIRHVEGYYALWDELVRRHPKLWIDSCASGGRRNDLETLRRAVPILRSDFLGDRGIPNYDPISQQNHVYGISLWMPYHGSGIEHVDAYWTRSLMGPIVGIGVDTRKEGWDYEQLRRLLQQIREVQPCYLGDYWPLTPYHPGSDAWCAYQFDLSEAGEGIVHAFRRASCAEPSITLKLRGLEPEATYVIESLDGGPIRSATGRQLLDEGLAVEASEPRTALLYRYARQ